MRRPIAVVQGARTFPIGRITLFGAIFAFFLHLCGGIRHLAWDAGYGFKLQTIYASGWGVVVASIVLTATTWIAVLVVSR
jgi:succinate dehydrogenase / fumarate reductase, cytochrome b subunit